MDNVRIENNLVNGSIVACSSLKGSGNTISNNLGNDSGKLKIYCHVQVSNNEGFFSSKTLHFRGKFPNT